MSVHVIPTVQGRAANAKQNTVMTEQQLKKACSDLQKSIVETDKESEATGVRIAKLESHRTDVAEKMGAAGESIRELRMQADATRS